MVGSEARRHPRYLERNGPAVRSSPSASVHMKIHRDRRGVSGQYMVEMGDSDTHRGGRES